ncbi:hypothetical protein NP233_g9918 [Leucocoprinus birnbaumii]|uniref:Uncharacterized protein n=1 Tax=Leucocoprinus birnbaumii TaxID=56174 RepID=A0AAD5VLA0_9AGAR|nr:hypothetical protein NP233_g9918 [Leucocoprinus birnbaumii]
MGSSNLKKELKELFVLSRSWLASAMETLVFRPSAVHIIHRCLQEFHGAKAEVESFEELFKKDFPPEEERLLKSSSITTDIPLSTAHTDNLRKDFLNAQALQYFVSYNKKLHRSLLPHRAELYIRIKNTVRFHIEPHPLAPVQAVPTRENKPMYIGASVDCPIESVRDAQSLTIELRIQFLQCAYHLIGTDQFLLEDAKAAVLVLAAIEDARSDDTTPDAAEDDDVEDKLKRVLTRLDEQLSGSPAQEERTGLFRATSIKRTHSPTSTISTVIERTIDPALLVEGVRDKIKVYHPDLYLGLKGSSAPVQAPCSEAGEYDKPLLEKSIQGDGWV